MQMAPDALRSRFFVVEFMAARNPGAASGQKGKLMQAAKSGNPARWILP